MDNKRDDGFVEFFDDDAIVTLIDDKDKPTDFYEIASVEYNEKFYEILLPAEQMDGMDDGEALIFEYDITEDDEEKKFKLVHDEEILETVFELYLKAVADLESKDGDGESGGCSGCSGCGGGCHH